MKKVICAMVVLASGHANAGLIEHINNGDFETGDFSGWNVVNTGSGAWNINNGTFVPGGMSGLPVISGNYDAVTSQSGPGFHNLYQDVSLGEFDSAILSWDDRIRSNAAFSDPNQEWRVLIEDLNGALISEVFSTNPGDTTSQIGANTRSYDLTALLSGYTNQTIRISFEQQDNLGFFSAVLDNVSFTTSVASVSEPATLALFGLGLLSLLSNSRRTKLNKVT
ncbi:PEP-CTERM sorting domain-containing protein (plasmid) [Catenovulum sp. SX2]|uniref:PEP-CTERM sorting domain-containing protein n=1 Tax=Catenovulum sp. SX2 TaxID=3398614 RepID=UPI003F87550E